MLRLITPLHQNSDHLQCALIAYVRTLQSSLAGSAEVVYIGGPYRTRTDHLLRARQALSQMS